MGWIYVRLSNSPAIRGRHPHFRAFTRSPAENDKSPAFYQCKIQHTRSIILGLTTRFKHLKRTKCVCGRGFAPDPTGGAHCAPQTSYLVYWKEWKGRVEDGVDYIRTENFVGGTELGQHPTPSSPSPAEAPRLATSGSASWEGKHWRITCVFFLGGLKVCYMKASFMFCMSDLQWLKNNNADTRTFLQCLRESGYGAVVIVTYISREP